MIPYLGYLISEGMSGACTKCYVSLAFTVFVNGERWQNNWHLEARMTLALSTSVISLNSHIRNIM